jgi:hypothetical protein
MGMFEHVGQDEPRHGGGFDGSRVILMVAAGGIVAAILFMVRDLGAAAARALLIDPVAVTYVPAEELPPGSAPGAVTAEPMPDPPPPPPPPDMQPGTEPETEPETEQGTEPGTAVGVPAAAAPDAAPVDAIRERPRTE